MSREDNHAPTPLASRVPKAILCRADCFISIHCNAADAEPANGVEALYRASPDFAGRMLAAVVAGTGLRNRGRKYRDELAVLKGPMPSVLIELGFLSNAFDRSVITRPETRRSVVREIAEALHIASPIRDEDL